MNANASDTQPSSLPNRPPNRKPARRWSPSRAAAMLASGATYEQVGDYFGTSKSTVHERMAGLRTLFSSAHIDTFRTHQAAVLTATRMRVLDVLNRSLDEPDAHRKNSPYQLAGTHHWLHSDERLEREQSTTNLGIVALVETVERDNARRRRTTTGSVTPALASPNAAQVPDNVGQGT